MCDTTWSLKPCPFCGNPKVYDVDERVDASWILCTCGISLKGTPVELVHKLWNTRPIEDALRSELNTIKATNNDTD